MSKERALAILKNALSLSDDFFHVIAIEEAIKELKKDRQKDEINCGYADKCPDWKGGVCYCLDCDRLEKN